MDYYRHKSRPLLGAILLSASIFLVLSHQTRCGAGVAAAANSPVITNNMPPKVSNIQSPPSLTLNNNNNLNSHHLLHQLGRSHLPYSSDTPTSAPTSGALNKPNNVHSMFSSNSNYQYDDPTNPNSSSGRSNIQKLQSNNNRMGISPSIATSITANYQGSMITNPYTNATHMLLLNLRQQLLTRALKFDEHFRRLLTQSKLSLHNMFVATYGMIYEHNTEIFTSMYEDLEQYYATGQIKLTKSLEIFFERLYQKIFQVYNSNRVFAPAYLECATEQLNQLKPFKDAPDKLISELRHAFVAARTFNQALNSGIDIIRSIISLGSPPQCTNLINEKLLKGPNSNGRPPCLGFCEQVISRCIGRANLDPLNVRWKAYVMSLADLAKKLSEQYNIELIIGPIDVQISDAIMNFQENAGNITEQVFQACGQASPHVSREAPTSGLPHTNPIKPLHNRLGKRAAPFTATNTNQQARRPMATHQDEFDSSRASIRSPVAASNLLSPLDVDAVATAPNLERRSPPITNEIRDFLLSTKNFWFNLPNSVCNSSYTLGSTLLSNGKSPTSCLSETLGLSDMNSDLRYRTEIQRQIHRLEVMQSKIVDAQRGVEIDWSVGPDIRQPASAPTASLQTPTLSQNRPTYSSPTSSLPSTTTTTTTSATTNNDASDLTEDEDLDDSFDSDDGPGVVSEHDDIDDDYPVDEELHQPNKPDRFDDTEQDEDEDVDEYSSSPTTSISPTDLPNVDNSNVPLDNDIDNMKPTIELYQNNELITASDQSPQKSGTASTFELPKIQQLLISLLPICTLSIVTNSLHTDRIYRSFAIIVKRSFN